MRGRLSLGFSVIVRRIARLTTVCFSFILASTAQAVVIDFDDIPVVFPEPDFPFFADYPITDEYLSQGLLVDGGYLWPHDPWGADPVSRSNYLIIGNWLTLSFVGELPTYVSMYVTPNEPYAVSLEASGPAGWTEQKSTTGFINPFNDTPWAPNQFIFFESSTGISEITLIGSAGSRTSGGLDNLTYHYASVPAPSGLALFSLGLFGILWRQRKSRAVMA